MKEREQRPSSVPKYEMVRTPVPVSVETSPEEEKKETENKVVRAFILQPMNTHEIKEAIEEIRIREFIRGSTNEEGGIELFLSKLFFTKCLFAEKDVKSFNAGQVVPVGGKIEKGEKKFFAVMRETMEETGMRVTNIRELGAMSYKLSHPERGILKTRATYFTVEALPTDIPCPINNDEDLFRGFPSPNLPNTCKLLKQGEFKIANEQGSRRVELLDSLIPLGEYGKEKWKINLESKRQTADRDKKTVLEETDEKNSNIINREFLKDFEKYEGLKELIIMQLALDLLSLEEETKEKWLMELSEASSNQDTIYHVARRLFREFVKEFSMRSDFSDILCQAVDLANFKEELYRSHAGRSKNEAILRFMYTLFETGYDYDGYLKLAGENFLLKDFVYKLENFLDALSTNTKLADSKIVDKKMMEKVKMLVGFLEDEECTGMIEQEFLGSFEIPEEKVEELGNEIDEFLDNISKIIENKIESSGEDEEVRELSEIRNASIADLLKYAFSCGRPKWIEEKKQELLIKGKNKDEIRNYLRRIVFEARRRLTLLYLFNGYSDHYEQVIKNGNEPIKKVLDELSVDQEIIASGITHFKSKILSDVEITQYDPCQKSKASFYRKMIERGQDQPKKVADIFRRAWVLEGQSEKLKTREKRKINICDFTKDKLSVFCKKREVDDISAVLDVVEKLSKRKSVKIVDYKPTPKNGEKLDSKSAGGGGNVRFAKFYILHTDKNGVERIEEMQIYTPSEDGSKTALQFKQEKEEDDKKYKVERLLKTEGMRSFVELMWPIGIYGDVTQKMFRKKCVK